MARDIEDDIEDGVVAYGRIKAIGGGIVGIIIAIIFCCVGFFMIRSSNKAYNNVIGRITSVSQCSYNNKCNIEVEYTINNILYKQNINIDSKKFPSVGKSIVIYYNPTDPNQIQTQSPTSKKLFGGGFMSVACLVIIGIFVHLYLVMKYDQAAVESAYSTSSRSGRRGLIVID